MNKLLHIEKLNKHFNGITALNDFSCTLNTGEILGLIGPNGAGKSTLFNVLTGFIPGDSGAVLFKGTNILHKGPDRISRMGIARTFQDLRLIRQMTVFENVLLSFQSQSGENLRNIFFRPAKSFKSEKDNEKKAFKLLNQAGISDKMDDLAGNLSYGQQKLLSIVCCLASNADLILLDEPVAGINPDMIEKILTLITELPTKGKSVIIIEHNIDAVMLISHRVIFMDTGKKISEGKPEKVRNDPKVIEAYLD